MTDLEQLQHQIEQEPNNVALLKQLAYAYDKAGLHPEAVAQYLTYLKTSPQDLPARTSLAWNITKRLKKLDTTFPTFKDTLLNYLLHSLAWIQGVERPSPVYSILLHNLTQRVRDYKRILPTEIAEAYLAFVHEWDPANFRPEDYTPYSPHEGFRLASLSQLVVQSVYRCALALESPLVKDRFPWCIDFLFEQIPHHPDDPWMPYYAGKLLVFLGDLPKAQHHFKELAKSKPDRSWVWQGLSETYPTDWKRQSACLCRALLCTETDEKFLSTIHHTLGTVWKENGLPSEALHEFQLEDDIRKRAGWRDKERDPAFFAWASQTTPSASNDALYSACGKAADRLPYEAKPKLELSDEQKDALHKIEAFLDSNDHVFLLRGYAGTGKTTLVRYVLDILERKFSHRPRFLVAPTGRAAKVLRDKCGKGETIHRLIYALQSTTESRDSEGRVHLKGARIQYSFPLKPEPWTDRPILIADEASMIASHTKENEQLLFGSGNLLADLLDYADVRHGGKVIFVGDPAQLPPIGENQSNALIEPIFSEAGLRVQEVTLRTVFRQKEGSILLRNAFRLRESLEQPKQKRQFFPFETHDGLFQKTTFEDVIAALATPGPDAAKSIAIAFSNATVRMLNQSVRQALYADPSIPQAGDRIVFVRNSYDHSTVAWEPGRTCDCVVDGRIDIYNGDSGTIEYVGNREEHISYVGKERVLLVFRNLVIRHESGRYVAPMVVETLLDSPYPDLSDKEESALFTDFVVRHPLLRTQDKRDIFIRKLQADPFFNALRIKYGYAITCHKSQGGEWKRVFVDFTGRNGLDDDAIRWSYTAITRSSEQLLYFGRDELSVYATLQWEEIQSCKKLHGDSIQWHAPEATKFHDLCTKREKRVKYHDVERVLPRAYEIVHVQSREYEEIYRIQTPTQIISLRATHDGAGVFSDFHLLQGSETDDVKRFLEALKRPIKHTFNVAYKPHSESLSNLYEVISGLCDTTGVTIAGVEERVAQYYIRYYFESDGWAMIHFSLNGKGQLTRANASSTKGNADTSFLRMYEKLKDALSL